MGARHLSDARAARSSIVAAMVVCVACGKDAAKTNPNQSTAGTAVPAVAGEAAPAAGMGAVTSGAAGGSAGMRAPAAGRSEAGSGGGGGTGMASAGTSAAAGSSAAGAGAGGSGAVGSGGNAAPGGCSRELLKTTTDTYYVALAAHEPAMLPRAENVKFTENGKVMELGQGLWQTAGMLKYKHTALDTESCSTVSESVVPDGSTDVPVGLRLKLQGQKIAEIETIVVRPGDYKVFGSTFPSNTNAIAASKDRIKWEEPVPADQRNTREEIQGWLDKYFRLFPRYGCNFADNCQRLENGGGSFECSAALSCEMSAMPSGRGALTPRTFVVDTETGIGVGFTLFMSNTDFHMIKMYGGKIYAVHAILGAASTSGWE